MTNNENIYSTLLNIDSTYRNTIPKHIYMSSNKILDNNPIKFIKNSNKIIIKYDNHNFLLNDNIIIQNVEGLNKILYNSIYLINNSQYAAINIQNNMIPSDYTNITSKLYINIELSGNQTENDFINNIPFNSLYGIKLIFIAQDIINNNLILNDNINKLTMDLYNSSNIDDINKQFIFFDINSVYNDINNKPYYCINQIFKISYLHINGIHLGNINANYPINNTNFQNSQTITAVLNENEFEITLNYKSFNTNYAGGNNIQIYKILNSIIGYPDIDNYTINLKKSFTNVINIELISTEIPYVDISIKKNINDKFYWKNLEDGDYIYSIQIDEGFYTSQTLIDKLTYLMNSIPRKNYSILNKVYNNFNIIFEPNNHKIIFQSYNLIKLPNSLSIQLIKLNNEIYYVLKVIHLNNILEVNDTIIIYNASNVTFVDTNLTQINSIDNIYINTTHIIYSINKTTNSYNIILGKKNEITVTITNYNSTGGENIIIKSKSKSSFLFDKPDTVGNLLGFNNIGTSYSVTDFKFEISNQDTFIYNINLNSIGNNISYDNGFLNLGGNYNYLLLFINDIEYIYNNNNIPSAFAKILLSGNPGDILFNTFVQQPKNIYCKSFPISILTDITILFKYPDGSRVNFRNINHSFTLKITEKILSL